jgi:hypothetical protein
MRLGDKVIYKGNEYEILVNRYNGMYDIAKVLSRGGMYMTITDEHRCVYAEELEVVK